MADGPKKFGRYFLLDLLAQGGMAEIYRARLASSEGAGRLIVIKRIQAAYGTNSEFLQMFRSEIKVTMGFNHPNIAQLYDFGDEQGQPYIAMELVDGRNLRQLMNRFVELKQKFPVDLAVHVIEQAACGLHYAHSFRDKISGEALNIVHRDISPQNLIISFEGSVKVIDFGIAKATTNAESTRAGVIKGKPSYLSPEQINGDALDGRSDIFSLGTVLWELLTGRKLFAGDNDLAVLKMIEACQTHVKPPSTLNPDVPPELDYIVLRALTKQRNKRFQSAEELQRALHKFLYTSSPDFNPSDLSYLAKDLFKNEIVEDRKKIQRLNEEVERLLSGPAPSSQSAFPTSSAMEIALDDIPDPTTLVKKPAAASAAIPASVPVALQEAKVEIERHEPTSQIRARNSQNTQNTRYVERKKSGASGRFSNWLGIGAAALIAVAVFGRNFGVEIPVVTPWVAENLDPYIGSITGAQSGATRISHQDPASKKSEKHDLGKERSTASVSADTPAAPPASPSESAAVSPSRTPADALPDVAPGAPKSVVLRLNLSPGGGAPTISLNGKPVNPDNPLIRVPLDSALELSVDRKDFRPFQRQFVLDSAQIGGLKEWLMDVNLEPVRFGYLFLNSTPSAEATLIIDGKSWTKQTPFENQQLPVGTYNVRLKNDVLGMEKTITIQIQEGRSTKIDERLEIKN